MISTCQVVLFLADKVSLALLILQLLREAGSSILEILKVDLISFVYIPVQVCFLKSALSRLCITVKLVLLCVYSTWLNALKIKSGNTNIAIHKHRGILYAEKFMAKLT